MTTVSVTIEPVLYRQLVGLALVASGHLERKGQRHLEKVLATHTDEIVGATAAWALRSYFALSARAIAGAWYERDDIPLADIQTPGRPVHIVLEADEVARLVSEAESRNVALADVLQTAGTAIVLRDVYHTLFLEGTAREHFDISDVSKHYDPLEIDLDVRRAVDGAGPEAAVPQLLERARSITVRPSERAEFLRHVVYAVYHETQQLLNGDAFEGAAGLVALGVLAAEVTGFTQRKLLLPEAASSLIQDIQAMQGSIIRHGQLARDMKTVETITDPGRQADARAALLTQFRATAAKAATLVAPHNETRGREGVGGD